jgi:glycosyltransferase involved in cell wall biosynthesis
MKVAIIVPGGVDRSGTQRVIPALLWLIERLARTHEVHVFALHQEPTPGRWSLLGASVHNAGARSRRLRTLATMMVEHHSMPFDLVHAFWAAGPGLVGAAFSRLSGAPCALTLPGGDLVAMSDIGYGARLTRRGRLLVDLALRGATRIVVPSRTAARHARAFGLEAQVIPYGVALDLWPPRRPVARSARAPIRLLHVATLNRVKDQATLLRGVAYARDRGLDFRLDIVGEDTLGGDVQRQCASLGLADRTRFHGFLMHGQLRPIVEASDVALFSSKHETVPIAALEAAVLGVPTVGSDVGQIADWAPRAAIAVPVGDSCALGEAILKLASDESLRLRLATAAQEWVLANDADVFAARTDALYVELASFASLAAIRDTGPEPVSR